VSIIVVDGLLLAAFIDNKVRASLHVGGPWFNVSAKRLLL